ncbi:MAG: hypothetical protein ACI8UR_000957 [Natronomonas sp.]|jgi:hypothetical protein
MSDDFDDDTDAEEDIDTSHLDNVDDGCGCTEIWEHMSDERDQSAD